MRRMVCVLVAGVALAGVVAYMDPRIWTGRWRGRADLRNRNSPRIPRLAGDLRGPRSRRP